jgi:phosphoribosyl-ATP pyrophosphohydrolase/phosphoribosyl-AMP cyclohydrolase
LEVEIRWDERGLVPAIVQDVHTGEVLMLAYMNEAALELTRSSGETWFWSRSRRELWHKGATSGNTQRVIDLWYDCDADTLLVRVEPAGPACHTGQRSCFYRRIDTAQEGPGGTAGGDILSKLEAIIQDRKQNPKPGSYTCQLLDGGPARQLKKMGEEAVEVIVAAEYEGDDRLIYEAADLIYHLLVLLAARELSWADVKAELARRFG